MLLFSFRIAGWGCVAAIVVLSLVPGVARPDTGVGQINHMIAYCGTADLLGLGHPAAKSRLRAVAMLTLLAAVLEVLQLWYLSIDVGAVVSPR